MNQKMSEEKKLAFLTILAETCNVSRAAEAIGIARITVYECREVFATRLPTPIICSWIQ